LIEKHQNFSFLFLHKMAAKLRQKKLDAIAAAAMPPGQKVIAQFKTAEGESTGPPLNLPGDATPEQLELLLNQLLNQVIYNRI
jgi:ribosome assembly protein 4